MTHKIAGFAGLACFACFAALLTAAAAGGALLFQRSATIPLPLPSSNSAR